MEGEFPDGTKIYCEHTSHHPPITNFLIEAPNGLFTIFGHSEFRAKMKGNHFNSMQLGPINIVFKDGHHLRLTLPTYKVGGVVMGERTIQIEN